MLISALSIASACFSKMLLWLFLFRSESFLMHGIQLLTIGLPLERNTF